MSRYFVLQLGIGLPSALFDGNKTKHAITFFLKKRNAELGDRYVSLAGTGKSEKNINPLLIQ